MTESDKVIFLISVYLNIIMWFFPLIRHHKGEYFLFFLVSNCSNVLTFITWKIFAQNTNLMTVFFSLLLIPVVEKNLLKKLPDKLTYIAVAVLLTAVFLLINSPSVTILFVLLIYLILVLIFLRRIILCLAFSSEINLIHPLLLFYCLSIVVKIYNGLIGPGVGYYNVLVFQILDVIMAVVFSVVTEKTKVFKIKI